MVSKTLALAKIQTNIATNKIRVKHIYRNLVMGMLFVPYWQLVQDKQPISRKRLPIYFSIKLIDVQLKYRYKHFFILILQEI